MLAIGHLGHRRLSGRPAQDPEKYHQWLNKDTGEPGRTSEKAIETARLACGFLSLTCILGWKIGIRNGAVNKDFRQKGGYRLNA